MNEYLSEAVMKDGRVFQKVIGKIDGVKDACKEQKMGLRPEVTRAVSGGQFSRRRIPA